jgi:hypothetical protein
MKSNVLISALLLAALAAPAAAAPRRAKPAAKAPAAVEAPATTPPCPADDSAAGPGLRAFIDPQTGQLREPTPEEAQALARAAREKFAREVESLEAIVHPDGMISLDLKGLFMQDLVVVKNPDGSLSMRCVPDSESGTVPVAPAPGKPASALEER